MTEVLRLEDSMKDTIMKMSKMESGGFNPGAMGVLASILEKGAEIDPDDVFKGFGTIMSMDMFEIRGDKIWMLFKDICKQDLVRTIGMIRACQLGFLGRDNLLHAINHQYGNPEKLLDVEGLMMQVRERLPSFKKDIAPPAAPAPKPKENIVTKATRQLSRLVSDVKKFTVRGSAVHFDDYKIFPKGKKFVVKRKTDNKLLKNIDNKSIAHFASSKVAKGCIDSANYSFE